MRAWFESESDAVTYAEGVTRFDELRAAWLEGPVVVYATIYVDRDEYGNPVQSVVKRRGHYSCPSLSAAAALFFDESSLTDICSIVAPRRAVRQDMVASSDYPAPAISQRARWLIESVRRFRKACIGGSHAWPPHVLHAMHVMFTALASYDATPDVGEAIASPSPEEL